MRAVGSVVSRSSERRLTYFTTTWYHRNCYTCK